MLSLLSLLAFSAPAPVRAQQVAPGAEASSPTPEVRLEHAINLYISGESAAARNELLVLVLDPALADSPVQREARIWLGEVQYAMGELQAAEDSFRTALAYDPELRLDPFVHPPDVVSFFEAIRATSEAPRNTPLLPPTPSAPPWLILAIPGGVQFYNEQPVLGAVTGGAVGGLGAVTLGMRLWLRAQDEDPDTWGVQVYDDPARVQTLRAVRAVENTLGFTALGIWGFGVTQGLLHTQMESKLVVGPGAVGVQVRF